MQHGTAIDDVEAALARVRALDRLGHERAASRDMAGAAQAWTDHAAALGTATDAMALALADALERAAGASGQAGQLDAAQRLAAAAEARLRGVRGSAAMTEPQFAARLARLGMLQCAMQQWNDAAPLLIEADALFAAAAGALPAQARREQAMAAGALATAHRFAGRPADALAVLRGAVARSEAHADAAPEDRIELAHLRNAYGQSLLEAGQPDAALAVLEDGAAALRALVAQTGGPPTLRNLLAAMLNRLGHAHAALGRRAEAASCLTESVDLMRALVEQDGLAGLADDLRTAEADLARLGG